MIPLEDRDVNWYREWALVGVDTDMPFTPYPDAQKPWIANFWQTIGVSGELVVALCDELLTMRRLNREQGLQLARLLEEREMLRRPAKMSDAPATA